MARPAGVVRSSASARETNLTPRCSSSGRVANRSVTERRQWSKRQTNTRSISRRRAAYSSFSRASRRAAPGFTSRTCMAIVQPRRVAYSRMARFCSPASAGHSSRHGGTVPPGTFFLTFVSGQKRVRIWLSARPVLQALGEIYSTRPESIVFGQAADILLHVGPKQHLCSYWPVEGTGGNSTASRLPDSSPARQRVSVAR